MERRRPRIIIGKLGLDGHTNGIRIVSNWLKDAGFEVIYMGIYNTPERIIKAALEEDVDLVGLSFLEGSHLFFAERLMELARSEGLDNVKFVFGGVIPPDDIPRLKAMGISEVFLPGTPREAIISSLRSLLGGTYGD
jgi:methylmalonyl-CoA mutase C-terminal domain/subunit